MVNLRELFPVGIWSSTDNQNRWTLDLNESPAIWTEKNISGQTFIYKTNIKMINIGNEFDVWRLSRPNDINVLLFLGASNPQDIISKNPNESYIDIIVYSDKIQGNWNGLFWKKIINDITIFQPGSDNNPKKNILFTFSRINIEIDNTYFKVDLGQLTFDQEGKEGGFYHSRKIHWPGSVSGVTIGRGYDMKTKSYETILKTLTDSNVENEIAEKIAKASNLKNDDARNFVIENKDKIGNITLLQQKKLFIITYEKYIDDVKRICNKPDVIEKYKGKVDFSKLNIKIFNILVDLHYRGDYTPDIRESIQKHIINNDIINFKKEIENKSIWPNVPLERFNARIKYLETNT